MRTIAAILFVIAGIAAFPDLAKTQEHSVTQILAEPITVERQAPVANLPITLRNGKLYIAATVDGQTSEFLFDTGSPTVLAKQFADTLNLEVVGRNTGMDSHGNQVTMEIAVVERLNLGDISFRHVPVLIHDFSGSNMGKCLIGNGVIGSEIFSGSAWRIDMQAKRLSIAADASALPAPTGEMLRTKLYDTGYPHAPIIDYSVGKLADKAMFDTGNSTNIAFFEKAAEHPSVKDAIVPNTLVQGEGYEGESAGGLSKSGPLTRFAVVDVSFSSGKLDGTKSIVRAMPPTLFGAGLLRSYIVTLDYPGQQMTLEKRTGPDPIRPDPGYGIAMIDGRAVVAKLFAGSAADRAGLKLGDHVIEAQGRSLTQLIGPAYCDTVKWLVGEFDPREATELLVQHKGGARRFNLPSVKRD